MATMAWAVATVAVATVAVAVVMDGAMVAQAVAMAGALEYMDMEAVAHLAAEDTARMDSTEILPKKLNQLVHLGFLNLPPWFFI